MNIISSIESLPLYKKIEIALLIYQISIDEERATILSLWYQYKHDYQYFEELALKFNDADPKIYLPPLSADRNKNYDFILQGIKMIRGFIGIEEIFLDHIKSTKEEFEIDRLLYVIFAVSSSYDTLSKELLNLSYRNWFKWGKIPFHYELLLHKTTIDILLYKKQHGILVEQAVNFFSTLEKRDRLYWFKYQCTNVLLNLYENGYILKEYSEIELLEKRDDYRHRGDMENYFYDMDNTI